jgi:hypothetical protein
MTSDDAGAHAEITVRQTHFSNAANEALFAGRVKEHSLKATRIPGRRTSAINSNMIFPRSRWSGLHWLLPLLVLFGTLSNAYGQTPGATVFLPSLKGPGFDRGNQYQAQCGPSENLMGFELRVGEYVDAIRPVCVVTYGATLIGNQVVAPTWNGGTGGHGERLLCPTNTPVVIGLDATFKLRDVDNDTDSVSGIHLFCGQAIAAQKLTDLPNAVFDTQGSQSDIAFQGKIAVMHQACADGQVAVGVHGSGGTFIDTVGLICGAPRKDTSGVALGRVQPTSPPVAMSICDRAKAARARNAPTAPALQAQCDAFLNNPDNALPICDQAQAALTQHAANALDLVAKCRAVGGMPPPVLQSSNQLNKVRNLTVAPDPMIAELRKRQPVANQPGFDIGIKAAEGQTVWGPGNEKIAASLPPPQQEGFKIAVSFSLDRNRNAKLAAVGANIAGLDPGVMQARTSYGDVRAWLGFDIASGIFGSPRNGALGNTVAGPGAMQIRNALSLPAQTGFDASMKLHLSRNFKPLKLNKKL